jgi:hypothetical protein
MLTIEPDGEKFHGPCPDCGEATRSVWGYVSTEAGARAVYYIRWTDFHLERGAQLGISIGVWGEASRPVERALFGVECRIAGTGRELVLVDAASVPWSVDAFLGMSLTRQQALGDSRKAEVFEILDRIVEVDPRFRAFLAGRMRE